MIEGWTCSRCSTANVEASIVCASCGQTRPDDVVAEGVSAEALTVPAGIAAEQGSAELPPAPDGVTAETLTPSAGTTGWALPGAEPGVAASEPRPFWRRIPITWLVVAVFVVGAGVVGWYFSAGRSSSGEITKSGDLTASELRIGDCFDLKDPSADEVEDVTAVPCTVAHEYEVVFVGSLPEGAYPAEAAFSTYVENNCQPAFGTYVGKAYDASDLDIFWFYPTDDAWRAGDRSVQCAAFHPRVHRLTESLKGSNQ